MFGSHFRVFERLGYQYNVWVKRITKRHILCFSDPEKVRCFDFRGKGVMQEYDDMLGGKWDRPIYSGGSSTYRLIQRMTGTTVSGLTGDLSLAWRCLTGEWWSTCHATFGVLCSTNVVIS